MKKIFSKVGKAIIPASLLPWMASAQTTIENFLQRVKGILNTVIGILFILMTIYFIWGVIQYVLAGGDEEKLKNGKRHMIYGLIGMAVAAAAWGIVAIIIQFIGVGPTTPPIPSF